MEPTKSKSSARCREGKRDVHPTPTKKDAYARLLGQHQSIKFKSYLEQFAQPALLIEDGEVSPPLSTPACPSGHREKEETRKRGQSFTDGAESGTGAPPRHNKHEKCTDKPSKQGQSPVVSKKPNQENKRDVRPTLGGHVDLGEGGHQRVELLCEDLNHKGSKASADEDATQGPRWKPFKPPQQTPEMDPKNKKDPSKKKSRKKNNAKADSENKQEQTQLVVESESVCDAKASPAVVRQQKLQGNVLMRH